MKNTWISKVALVSLLAAFSVGANAAPQNQGPKPNCKLGEIPVKKGDLWVCDTPHIQAAGGNHASSAATSKRAVISPSTAPSKRPSRER